MSPTLPAGCAVLCCAVSLTRKYGSWRACSATTSTAPLPRCLALTLHPCLPAAPQQLIYNGEVGDEHPVLDTLLAIHPSIQRYSPALLGLDGDSSSGDSSSSSSSSPTSARPVDVAAALQHPAAATLSYLEYLAVLAAPAAEAGADSDEALQEAVKSVTHWVVADLAAERGRALALEAVVYMQEYVNASNARIALVANPSAAVEQQGGSALELLWGLASGVSYGITDVRAWEGGLACCVAVYYMHCHMAIMLPWGSKGSSQGLLDSTSVTVVRCTQDS